MDKREVDVAVIGAGLAGLASAYYLLKKQPGSVAVLEMEKEPGLGASTQNAAMICRFDEDETTAAMCAEGARLLEEDFVPALGDFGFRKTGSVFVASGSRDSRLRAMASNAARSGVIVDALSRAEALKLFPFLSDSQFDSALYSNADAVVDARKLVDALAKELSKGRCYLICGRAARVTTDETGAYLIKSAFAEIRAKKIVNAAGAWAADIARAAGAQNLRLEPLRRHLFVTAALRWANPDWPIVWDVANDVYFRADGRKLWFSPCDESRHAAGPVEPDPKIEKTMREKIAKILPRAEKTEWSAAWAGLRTFAPDRRFVIGEDKILKGFYWVAGLGGHGVTACAAAGRMLASIVAGDKVNPVLAQALSPKRFS